MGQAKRFEISFAERQRQTYALVGCEGKDRLAVLNAEKIGDAQHRV